MIHALKNGTGNDKMFAVPKREIEGMNKQDTKIRFGMIGSNYIVEQFMKNAALCPDFELTAIYSRSYDKAKKIAEEKQAKYAFDDLEELADCEEIDAIYIASPTCCHAAQSIQMMKAGKHVLCEKPLASNSREVQEMYRVAKENHVFLMEAMRPAHNPNYDLLREQLPKLGKIRQVHLNYCQYSSRYDKFKDGIVENAFKRELSNGAIMDIGCYCIHVMVMLFGKPEKIQAMGIQLPNSIDGEGTINFSYPDFYGTVNYSKITDSKQCNEIQGEEGILTFQNLPNPDNMIFYNRNHRSGPEFLKQGKQENQMESLTIEQIPYDMCYEINMFMEGIRSGKLNDCYEKYSIETMEIIDEARKQMKITFPADEIE